MKRHALLFVLACFAAGGCYEPLDDRPSLVVAPRVLAVVAEPAEALPGTTARYRVLAADAAGALTGERFDFSYCETTRAANDPRTVAPRCATREGTPLEAHGAEATGQIPSDACEAFGPSAADGARPANSDTSGGYYQPLRVRVADALAIGLHRVRCPLPDAPIDIALAFRDRYVPNENPRLQSLAAKSEVGRGERVTLRITASATSAERYVRYEPGRDALIDTRETLRVAWYTTGGELERARAEVRAGEPSDNTWLAPSRAGRVHLWAVLRDDRGGIAFEGLAIDVR